MRDNCSLEDINPAIPVGISMKAKNLTDVAKLLEKHFGSNWGNLEAPKW